MCSLIEMLCGCCGCELQLLGELLLVLFLLDVDECVVLLCWVCGEVVMCSCEVLFKEVGSVGLFIEKVECFCQCLLQEGWVSLCEELSGGNWLWKFLSWCDLCQL